jgi:hypothetical protein
VSQLKRRLAALSRQPIALAATIGIVVILVSGGVLLAVRGGTAASSPTPGTTAVTEPSPAATETLAPSPSESASSGPTALPAGWAYSELDGVPAPTDAAHREPVAVMISDNKIDRPQSGLSTASIVYQAPMEGGEIRLMAVFQEGDASAIGGVRSARPFFVYWATEYKAVFGHVGGDPKTLSTILPAMKGSIYNLDGCAFARVSGRPAPHNDYTSTNALRSCSARYGYPTTSQQTSVRRFRDDSAASDRPSTQTVSIVYPTGTMSYAYDPSTDSYARSAGGVASVDPANGKQVYARNLVLLTQNVSLDPQTDPGYHRILLGNVGSGPAAFYIEGKEIKGTWKKASNTALTTFYDEGGQEIQLVRGSIFIQSVPPDYSVSVK